MRGLFEGARTIKPGQKWLCELFKGAVFSRARSDQGNTVTYYMTKNYICNRTQLQLCFCMYIHPCEFESQGLVRYEVPTKKMCGQ